MKSTLKSFFAYSFFAVFAMITLKSCDPAKSVDVNQDTIYAEYELFYDKNQDKTFASAVFKFNNSIGTNLQLTAPSEVRFNADAIPYDGIFAYYRKEYAGRIVSGTFTFKDTKGTTYINVVTLSKEINSTPTSSPIDTLRRTSAYTYTWVGDAIGAGELGGLTIGSNAVPTNFQVFLQGTIGANSFILPLTQLNLLPIGSSYCQLDRQIEVTTGNFTSAGGKLRGKYRGLNKNLYVK